MKLFDSVKSIAQSEGLDPFVLMAFIQVETGGIGFADNGKLIIQFEPAWFRKKEPFAPSGKWSVNKVDVQSKEWEAFNNAFSIDPESAMQSTSIGIGQIMGFNYKRIGFNSVGEMWDDAKVGIENQIQQICKFIKSDKWLSIAIKYKDWNRITELYNGKGYKALAKKIGRIPYDEAMKAAYNKLIS